MKKSSLLNPLTFNDSKPAISVLFETDNTKEIRIAMKKHQVMKEHKTSFPITIEIFEGSIEFGVNGTIENLIKGDLAYLEASISHDLVAKEDSIIRLTISKSDTVDRVIKVSES